MRAYIRIVWSYNQIIEATHEEALMKSQQEFASIQ